MPPSKWENLSGCSKKLIHFCNKLQLALDCRQSKYSLQIYNIHIFSILDVAFAVPFLCKFQKLQLLVLKNIWNNFCCIVLLFVWPQKECLRFWKSYYFCPSWCLFWQICSTEKLLFWQKKHQRWNLRHTFVEKVLKINVAKY